MALAKTLPIEVREKADEIDGVLAGGDPTALADGTAGWLREVPALLIRGLSFGIGRARSEGIANDARRIFGMILDMIAKRDATLFGEYRGVPGETRSGVRSPACRERADRLLREAEIALPTVALSQATTAAGLAVEIEARRGES